MIYTFVWFKKYIYFYLFKVRDEYRTDFDVGRGGYGQIVKQKLEMPESFQ